MNTGNKIYAAYDKSDLEMEDTIWKELCPLCSSWLDFDFCSTPFDAYPRIY